MRVLIVRFSAIGDCVMAGYAVNDLRSTYPDVEITWVVEDRCAGIVSDEKLVHRKLALPRSEWRPKGEFRTLFAQYKWLTSLRRFGFDYGFDLQGHSKTAWCLRLSGAKNRLSIGATDVIAKRLNPVLQDASLESLHSVERSRRVVGSVLPLKESFGDFLPGGSVSIEPKLVTICVGAGHPLKTIPPNHLREVGTVLKNKGFDVVYLGGANDSLDEPDGTRNLAGKTSIEESVDWIRRSAAHIAGDTGTGHIAAAVGTPLVTIWGNMPLTRFRPYTDRVTVLNRDGLPAAVSPGEIVEATMGWVQ